MSGIENWIQKLRKAEKTCIIQDGITIILEKNCNYFNFIFLQVNVKYTILLKIKQKWLKIIIYKQMNY
jgi:hypothetical protein